MKSPLLMLLSTLICATSSWAQPGSGYMLETNGSSSYVNCGTINLSGNQITLQTWVYVDAFKTNFPYITSVMGTEQTGNHAAIRFGDASLAANRAQFILRIGSVHVKLNGTIALEADSWNHVAATYDGSSMKIYINGILDVSNSQTGNFTSNSTFELARNYANSRILDGFIDESSVFDVALSQQTIREWMCKKITSSHPNYANIVGYWPMDEGTGNSADDASGNGYDGSLSGSPSWEYSGAPIGDVSKYIYSGSFNIGLSSTQGDSINYAYQSGNAQGVHIYRVDSVPYNTDEPSPLIEFDTTHYWGIYTLGNPVFETAYYYGNNSFIGTGDDCFVGMGTRFDGYVEDWENQGFNAVNYSSQVVTWIDSIRAENMLAISAIGPHTFAFDLDQPTCNGDSDGEVIVHVSGGQSPYTYAWAAGSIDSVSSNLSSGYHVFTVTDNNDCESTDSVFLDEPTLVTGLISASNASCALISDGEMTVMPNGGSNSGFTYQWNDPNSSTTASISGLATGTYSVTITDSEGCEGIATASISSIGPDPIPNLGSDTNVCGETTWGMTASVLNGPATSYAWSTGETSPIKIVSTGGTYSLTVTNSAGCEGRDTIEVTYVDPVQVELPNSGTGTGSYTIEATEGFTFYQWSNSETGQSITVSTSGSYSVTATDSNGCQSSDTIEVTIKPMSIGSIANDSELRIWPNPTMSHINIENTSMENAQIKVFDPAMRLIAHLQLTANTMRTLDLSQLDDGLYIIQMSSVMHNDAVTIIKTH